jgi:hypothetical protein
MIRGTAVIQDRYCNFHVDQEDQPAQHDPWSRSYSAQVEKLFVFDKKEIFREGQEGLPADKDLWSSNYSWQVGQVVTLGREVAKFRVMDG